MYVMEVLSGSNWYRYRFFSSPIAAEKWSVDFSEYSGMPTRVKEVGQEEEEEAVNWASHGF